MLTTFNFRAQPGKETLYRQLADYFRQEIRQQHLVSQDFLPSIRKLTRDLKLSRTTVENAYQILIDQGYVENLPNRGYRVAVYQPREASEGQEAGEELRRPEVRWNFSNNYIDTSTFDTVLWRRCLNQVLRNPASIAGYGDPQGEPELRRVLARYSYASRGVVCRPEQILVGAGLQTLLLILLPLLPLDQKVAGLEAPGFPQAEQIFHLMGWKTRLFDPADPKGDWPGLLMISPANPYKGRALTEKERNNLIVATQLERVYLLEDDYNGEFRYLHRPTPALHSFGNREQIIYLGSFSRTMLPSLRISYLAYIEEGHLTRHIRKLRSLYRTKSRRLKEELTSRFGSKVRLLSYGSGLHLHIALDLPGTAEELARKALAQGVRVIPVRGTEPGRSPEFLLSFAGIPDEKIREGVEAFREALEK